MRYDQRRIQWAWETPREVGVGRVCQGKQRDRRSVMITGRELLRHEVERVWEIDRTEVIDNVYSLENGVLVLKPEHDEVSGWPPGRISTSMSG